MVNRKGLSVSLIVALVVSASALAQKKDDKKQSDDQKKEIQAAVKLADDAAAGQAAANDLGSLWVHEDFMKAQGNKQYAPFTVTLDPAKVTAGTVVFYWRAVSKNPPPPVPEGKDGKDGKDAKKDDKKTPPKRPEYAYEDVSFVPVTPGQMPVRISRSLTLPAGPYDVYVVVKEPASAQKNAPPAKASVVKQTLTVPDFWNNELTTSSVIIAQRIDPLPAPLTPQQQAERPYALNQLEIVPVTDMKMNKKVELQTFMVVYNPKIDGTNKPDVLVEYNFCQAAPGNQPKAGEPCKAGEKFFNKTTPQALNKDTLPPQFDVTAGHQLQAGQGVPLASFPEGDYRLEIKVTDKIANKSVSRDVNFTVSGS